MENHENRNSESDFINFFKGLDESYQRFVIDKMKTKPPDSTQTLIEADSAGQECDPESR